MLPIRSIVLALCATVAIAAPLSGTVCPSDGDCPTCYGRETPDLRDIVCNSESAFIVATGVDTDGMKWASPRRWQDIFGAQGSRYAVEHFPIDERHWDNEGDSTCRTYYAKPAYEITKGQAPRRVQTPDVAGFNMNQKCSCIGLIAEAGYAVVAFKNRTVAHSDELATQSLNKDVVVVPLPRGEFKIPSCDAKFAEDKSAISTEKLPAVFSNDETQLECNKVASCPKCEVLQHPEQLKDICQSSKELMIVKQALSREVVSSPEAPWQMPKIEVYVDKDNNKQGAYEIRTKITPRHEEGCAKPTFRVLTGLTDNIDGVYMLKNMQLGEQCQCDFIRREHGFAMIRSERELHKADVLSDKETIIMLPRGHYVLPQCPREDESQRSDNDEDEKAQCDQPEDSCPVCEEPISERELQKSIESGDAYVVKMQTSSHLKKSEQSDDVRCATADVISVYKGEKENVNSELSFTLPEKCRCGPMSGYGRQFYAVVKKDAVEGERLEKLPLNEKVFIVGHNYRSNNLVQRWLNPESVDEAEDRSGYDGYASYAPSYSAPSYAPSYPAPSYGYSAPSYPAPSYGYSAPSYPAPSYGYSAPSYPAPSYPAPSYPAPSYSAPAYPAPSYGYSAPSYAPLYSSSYSYMTAPSYGIDYAPSYPAPSYGYSAPAYPAPSYGYSAPAYPAPSYGYSAPSYSAPSYSAPSYPAPSYSAPSYSAPSYPAPSYSAPSYSAPSYSAPSYPAPSYSAPSYSAPSYSAPSYSAPSYSAPAYGYSAPSYGYSAPAYGYSAPSYDSGYSSYGGSSYGDYAAPSYPAPSYSAPAYPAPSYSAPAYPAPSYSAPAYAAPSYSAPAYPAPSYSAPAYSAPSYSAPAYPAPSYSAPAYPAPSYSAPAYSAPSYPAPSYSAPSYAAPSYDSYSAPSYSAPSYSAPSYSAPSYSAPSYSAPSYSAPSYSAPSYSAPSYSAPSYSAPAYSAPSYPAPSYSAPAYAAPSYSAPSYAAPAYSAPAYAAPAYSAPAYAAPAYPAPAYAAPAYSDYPAPAYGGY